MSAQSFLQSVTAECGSERDQVLELYARQISFIGIARSLGLTVREVVGILRANGLIRDSRG